MDSNPQASPSALLDLLKTIAIPLATVVGTVIGWFLNGKKRRQEGTLNEAGVEKTRAEAQHLKGDTLDQAWDRITELIAVNSKLTRELDLCEIRGRFSEQQQKKMKALLDIHGIKYSEFDEPKS
jgi:hypothetical protein